MYWPNCVPNQVTWEKRPRHKTTKRYVHLNWNQPDWENVTDDCLLPFSSEFLRYRFCHQCCNPLILEAWGIWIWKGTFHQAWPISLYSRLSTFSTKNYSTKCWRIVMKSHKLLHVGKTNPPLGGRVLPYMGYIGMCRYEGYGFQVVFFLPSPSRATGQ